MQKKLDEIIGEMEPGLKRATLRALSFCVGADKAINKEELLNGLGLLGYGRDLTRATFERQVRRAIVELRKEGQLICSSSGDGGYFLAADQQEFDVFVEAEYRGKIQDMQETMDAMVDAATRRWGNGMQMGFNL